MAGRLIFSFDSGLNLAFNQSENPETPVIRFGTGFDRFQITPHTEFLSVIPNGEMPIKSQHILQFDLKSDLDFPLLKKGKVEAIPMTHIIRNSPNTTSKVPPISYSNNPLPCPSPLSTFELGTSSTNTYISRSQKRNRSRNARRHIQKTAVNQAATMKTLTVQNTAALTTRSPFAINNPFHPLSQAGGEMDAFKIANTFPVPLVHTTVPSNPYRQSTISNFRTVLQEVGRSRGLPERMIMNHMGPVMPRNMKIHIHHDKINQRWAAIQGPKGIPPRQPIPSRQPYQSMVWRRQSPPLAEAPLLNRLPKRKQAVFSQNKNFTKKIMPTTLATILSQSPHQMRARQSKPPSYDADSESDTPPRFRRHPTLPPNLPIRTRATPVRPPFPPAGENLRPPPPVQPQIAQPGPIEVQQPDQAPHNDNHEVTFIEAFPLNHQMIQVPHEALAQLKPEESLLPLIFSPMSSDNSDSDNIGSYVPVNPSIIDGIPLQERIEIYRAEIARITSQLNFSKNNHVLDFSKTKSLIPDAVGNVLMVETRSSLQKNTEEETSQQTSIGEGTISNTAQHFQTQLQEKDAK